MIDRRLTRRPSFAYLVRACCLRMSFHHSHDALLAHRADASA
jgi:hypothetical protein